MEFTLEKDETLPLYYQLKKHILELIQRGELLPGQMLPSEREFQEMLSISRATVRQALNELVSEGYLERHQGVGTVVAHKKITPQLLKLTSFSEDMRARGFEPGSITLRVEQVFPPFRMCEVFGISREMLVRSVYRLRLANNEPVGLQRLYIPPWIPALVDDLLHVTSYYQLLEQRFNITIDHAMETLTARNATAQEAELLKVAEGLAVLYIERTSFDKEDRAIEYVEFMYRADRYQYELRLYR